ncbi:AAA family ATPase [Salinigranum sp. GCM10025319]|uniref:AAA family ATPase n=1 Tax=Salinigranum sp. GCM10025319 TaxID=3252687 RepID=UPI00360B6E27
MSGGIVFAIAGAKGGVGKTTTSINLSAVLASIGHDVVLVELDLAMANVADFLDLNVRLEHGRDPTLHDVLVGDASVADATYEAPGGFDVVPSGVSLKGFARVDIDASADVVSEVRTKYDVVVLDTGAGLGTETVLPLSLADETILVSSPRVAAVRDTKKTRNLVRHTGGSVAGIVFSKSGSGRSPGVDRIADFLSVDLLGHVPEDSAIASAQDLGRPVVVAQRESDAAKAYRALGSRVHERVGELRAARAQSDNAGTSTAGDDDEEDEEVEGFTFDGDTTDAGSDGSDTASESAPVTGAGRSDRNTGDTSNGAVTLDASVDASPAEQDARGDGDEDGGASSPDGTADTETNTRSQSGFRPEQRRASRRTSAESSEARGATDEEIAERLASVETDDNGTESTTSTGAQRAEQGEESDASTADSPETPRETADSRSENDRSWESKQSATKQFIDRAIDLIDRRGD